MENIVEKILKERCRENNVYFVFPTQTAADLWSDRIIDFSDVSAIASERFMAWDDFKGSAVRGKAQNKRSIPASVRKFFAGQLIKENAEKPFFKNIIPPLYAASASNFRDYIASILPSLAQWKKYFDKAKSDPDDEDLDYLELFSRYKSFLDSHGLFDPAWETPPFESNGIFYYIFFPQILTDYIEYKDILSTSKDIELVNLGEEKEEDRPPVDFFLNSRQEIKNVALYLHRVHKEKNVPWNKIAVSVPDMETYAPYIERDFDLYEIPYVLRNGKPLASCGAGSFFEQMKDCVQENFSFESLKNLLLNNRLPWAKKELNEQLINFGRNNNCICSFKDLKENKDIDVWLKSFDSNPMEERLRTYYLMLKEKITGIVNASSFSELRKKYFELREKIFDVDLFTPSSDAIISRCISELGTLIDLEKDFFDCLPSDSYSFFCSYLKEKNYLAQTDDMGVQILPYKLSAAAPFDVQVVVDSSQSSLSLVYRQLAFLTDEKRAALGLGEDPDVSSLFIRLYAMNAKVDFYFTAAGKTFNAYAISHSFFKEHKVECGEEEDPYLQEKKWLLEGERKCVFPKVITAIQKEAFTLWSSVQSECVSAENKKTFAEEIKKRFYINEKISVSASSLNAFYSCPRSFFLNKIINIQEVNNEAELIDRFEVGNIFHKIMENFCLSVKEKKLPLDWNDDYKKIAVLSVEGIFENLDVSYLAKILLDTTKKALTASALATIESFCTQYKGCSVDCVEKEYSFYPDGVDYFYKGRIDCLLYNSEEDEYILIDFKSSASAIHSDRFYLEDSLDIPDMQMPMYIYLLENQKDKKDKRIVENAAFFNVNTSDEKKRNVPYMGKLSGLKEDVDLTKTNERFLELAEKYVNRIKNQEFEPDNRYQDFSVCRTCAYKAVCRRTFTVSRGK